MQRNNFPLFPKPIFNKICVAASEVSEIFDNVICWSSGLICIKIKNFFLNQT